MGRRLGVLTVTIALGLAPLAMGAGVAQAAAFPVNPGPIVKDRPITGTGQNLPPMDGEIYNIGSYPADNVIAYYDNGIDEDRADVALAAWRWTRDWVAQRCGSTPQDVRRCKATVVFDVDETLLDGYSYYATQDPAFSYDSATWEVYVADCGYAPIPQTRTLFNRLKKLGVRLVLISGGSNSDRAELVECLNARGISGWDRYILRTEESQGIPATTWKASKRAGLQRDGLRVLASVGDQVSDMSLGHLRHGFLLPNPIYYLP